MTTSNQGGHTFVTTSNQGGHTFVTTSNNSSDLTESISDCVLTDRFPLSSSKLPNKYRLSPSASRRVTRIPSAA